MHCDPSCNVDPTCKAPVMPPPSPLWTFAHRALSPQFHEDPQRFAATLDGNAAPRYLEQMWQWAVAAASAAAGANAPAKPPLSYQLQRLSNGVLVRMQFREVQLTGEPWAIVFAVKAGGYARMFLLEHSEYASELAGTPQAIICESCPGGKHQNWGATLAPGDLEGFERFVFETVKPRGDA
jgi:hypothetical protein